MMLVLSIVHSQIVSTTTISKKNFLKTPRSHSPKRAKRGHPTSNKIKSKCIVLLLNLYYNIVMLQIRFKLMIY